MVYESSTRRIYSSSSPRPVISTSYSYSPIPPAVEDDAMYYNNANYFVELPMLPAASPVGPIPVVTKLRRQPHLVLAYTPGTSKGHIINPLAIPRVAHRRLVAVSPPPHRALNGQNYYDMLESGITGHYGNRIILFRYRPSPPPVQQSKVLYIEDVTNANSYGRGTQLLRRELSPSPAPTVVYGSPYSPWDTTPMVIPASRPLYSLHNIPLRSASEVKEIADMRRLYVRDRNPDVGYSPLNKALMYRMPMPIFVDPTLPQSYYIGRGNLACLSFAGGRPIPKRRRFYPDYEDKVRDEVIFRSFYTKLREAAAAGRKPGRRPIYQPIYYSKKTILGEENVPKREPKESKWVERALANEKPPTPRANKAAVQPASVATETVVVPPRKESLKLATTPATPPPVKPVSVTLPGPRKSITEIIREDLPVESLPEENITVKMPKEPTEPALPSPPIDPRTEETVILPSKPEPREPTPPPKVEESAAPPPPVEEPAAPPPVKETIQEAPAAPAVEEVAAPPTVEEAPAPPVEEAAAPSQPEETAPTPTAEEAPAPTPVEETPAPPVVEETSAPTPVEESAPSAEPPPTAEEPPTGSPIVEEAASEPPSEVSAPVASAAADQESHDEASNKGEVEDIQLDEEITLDEVCDVEENDLEIESDDPEASQSAVESVEAPPPPVESPQETEGSSANEPANDQQDVVPPAPVSIVVADIDGPIPVQEEAPAVQEEPQTVEQIQAEAERRRAEFAQLLEEHAELVTTVTKLERVAVIVSKSCAEALAQQEHEQQPPPSTTDSQKSK